MVKKILFVTWDGPQSTYMEGLFMPIFSNIQKVNPHYQFHVLQFTWASELIIAKTASVAENLSIIYNSKKILRKPHPIIGSFLTMLKGSFIIKKYLEDHNIEIVMPRSDFPAIMVNMIRDLGVKILFDADGLPLEERVENGGLKRSSILYKYIFNNQEKMITNANGVLVRSHYAVDYFLKSINDLDVSKFFRVANGRNINDYQFDINKRISTREEFNLMANHKLLIYVGSLGGKYALKEMLHLFEMISIINDDWRFLILTPSLELAKKEVKSTISKKITIKTVAFNEVSRYLSAADAGLCLIKQSPSMTAVAATKLGEYLIAGLPVIMTSKIGDFDYIFKNKSFCLLLENNTIEELKKGAAWLNQYNPKDTRENISQFGVKHFSVESAANSYIEALDKLSL